MSTQKRPVLKRGDACDHTEHAIGGPTGYTGRFFADSWGGAGEWEPCPNAPSYGAMARAEALSAGDPDWMNRTSWDPCGR